MTSQVAGSAVRRDAGVVAARRPRPDLAPDTARTLRLALACLWLLDAALQFQAFMFSRGFGRMLGTTAQGNPAVIADPITWSAQFIQQHGTAADAAFATTQLLIALGIAWRPTVRVALGFSIAWSLAVWWLGEGLGGVLNGTASPVNGAPGAVLIYALLAVLLWPRQNWQDRPAVPFAAASYTGTRTARLLWLAVWGGLAWLALVPATRAPGAASRMITGMAVGQPAWLVALDSHLAAALRQSGLPTAIALAAVLAIVAVGVYLPKPALQASLMLAIVTGAALWIAQGLGGILTGSGTDPNSGPLLVLLALAFWPRRDSERRPG